MTRDAVQRTVQKDPSAPDLHPGATRPPDPNVAQGKASSPEASVWVNASAGSGKTKVLTDRILRLMLPRADGRPGTPPERILAITFTKAGAGVMRLRIGKILSAWAVMPPNELKAGLSKLLGREAEKRDTEAARKLFAQVVDIPGGLKIMTIHAFCQSVLSRFPLEAGLTPYFTVLEEKEASLLLTGARDAVMQRAQNSKTAPLGQALERIAQTVGEDQFRMLLADIVSERAQLGRILAQHFGPDGLYTATCAALDVPAGKTPEDWVLEACSDAAFDAAGLRRAMTALLASKSVKDAERGQRLATWLESSPAERAAYFRDYRLAFFKKDGEQLKNLATQVVSRAAPDVPDILVAEAERLYGLQERINAATCAMLTRDLVILGEAILHDYQELKTARGALDFDDMIFITLDLLEGRTSRQNADKATGWVLYKLDQGLDHILIDEAQDTNPEQWKIVQALCDDFFAGTGAREHTRTFFAVGDEKQSIYSFQRASPREFMRMHDYFQRRIQEANALFEDVQMNVSFRSARSILQAVDATFAQPAMSAGLSRQDIQHHAFHGWRGGHVELWPLYETLKNDTEDFWAPPLEIVESSTGAATLARQIAEKIKAWLDSGEILASRGRPINPGDIMILVRTRTAFFNQLVKALKSKDIPVSGIDRMIVGEQLAVQDILAAAGFSLMPGDDLTLACLLKSPLIGMTEEALYNLAANRVEGQSLWSALQANPEKNAITKWLSILVAQAGRLRPYEFFSRILQLPCPADAISGLRAMRSRLGPEVIDPLDEFMTQAIDYEQGNIPTLQEFLHWQEREESEVKREMSEHGAEVRIMTVHGAKGLEAPIVILPDTVRTSRTSPSQAGRRLLWPDKSDLDFPLWSPRASFDFPVYEDAARTLDERADEEYKRLLYVAMTRAEERLYICGFKGLKDPLPTSWYNFVFNGLTALPDTEHREDGVLVLENKQTREEASSAELFIPTGLFGEIPAWLYQQAAQEKPLDTLTPSHMEETDQPVFSPLQKDDAYRFRRGNLTHKLLEFLPGIPSQSRLAAAENFLKLYASDLPAPVAADIARETIAVLSDPQFAPIFGPGSQAEVPLTGRIVDGHVITGQVDRLLITENEVWIIDYKTNRPPPATAAGIPALYRKQMQAYADTLRRIYPRHRIHAALLWTDGLRLMPVDIG